MASAVIDVGSNTVRLLVADQSPQGLVRLCTRKARLRLGEEIERDGRISELKLAAVLKAVRKLSIEARDRGSDSLDVLVTAPGRQAANGEALVAVLKRASRAPVRVLSAEEEAALAFEGAVAVAGPASPLVAVCDLGGASTELAVGQVGYGPSWVRSVDLGALRLTARMKLGDRPEDERVESARVEVARTFDGIVPPLAGEALAVGGCARALRRIVGDELGPDELEEAERLLRSRSLRTIERRYGVHRTRAALLLGSVLIFSEVQRRVVVPLRVTEGGVREGALLASLARAAA
jgi:exopolyphosphatase / guanosine-5'-triphosphate,3'-diphosphate pyrophosphatase